MSRHDAGGRSGRIVADPGPIDGEGEACDHCPERDPADAVYRVPDPSYGVASVSALCPFHLAVMRRRHPRTWGKLANHEDYHDVRVHVQEGALLERGDLPEEFEHDGARYQRFGLDEKGKAYFVVERAHDYHLVETDRHFEVVEDPAVPRGELLGLLDHVEEHVGWRWLSNEWVNRAYAEDGGEQA